MKLFLKILGSTLVIGLCAIASSKAVFAHVLKIDNGISAVLHISPDDNAVAGRLTTFDIWFGDVKRKFNLQDCNCSVTIKSNGQILQSIRLQPALAGATLSSVANDIKFPTIGVYDVLVQGNAKDGVFNSFQMDYVVRVAQSVNATGLSLINGENIIILGSGCVVILGLFAYQYITSRGRHMTTKLLSTNKRKVRK